MKEISIQGRLVGPGHPCFVIAEAGVNHNGDVEIAKRLVDVAADAGADAVKFQTFTADTLVALKAPKADYQLETTDPVESQYDMLRRLELTADAHRRLVAQCVERGILFMSTPFDEESADFLDELGVPVFKTPSPEITNMPFLGHVASKGKPMIVSTGTAHIGEVEAAVRTIQDAGNHQFVLLHCVSSYPAEPADANLRAMHTMASAFDVPVGYSDHTQGMEVPLAAAALAACVIEKHFTVDRAMPGPDHRASLEPDELATLVKGIHTVESALGHGRKEPTESEASTAATMRRSLVAARDIPAGVSLNKAAIALRRPGSGLPPAMGQYLVGRKAKRNIEAGTLLDLEMLE